jgi:hypothetical protein
MTSNPWPSIPLADYEGHMDAIEQLGVLSALFARALEICAPTALPCWASGAAMVSNTSSTPPSRESGADINARYLNEVQQRFGNDVPLELHCSDLAQDELRLAAVALVHAAVFFEHVGVGRALDNALALVSRRGHVSIVFQLPDPANQA